MNTQSLNGKIEMAQIIVSTWSSKFYENLKGDLILAELFKSEYEGEIKNKGDTVKVTEMNLEEAETLIGDKQKFKDSKIQLTGYDLKVNRQTVHAVTITDLANLQSEEFMNKLKIEMTYQIAKKIELEIRDYYFTKVPVANRITVKAASDYSAADIAAHRTLCSRAKLGADRFQILSPEYYGDLLTKQQIVGAEYVNVNGIMTAKVPSVLGFSIQEHNEFNVDTGIFGHKSGLHVVMQRGLNINVVSKLANNELAFMVVADVVWDMKEFDVNRLFSVKEA